MSTGARTERGTFGSTAPGFAWGLVDQCLSSATNLALALLAGRILGPGGLGAVAVGFSVYLAALALQRALLTDPLVATSTVLSADSRRLSTRMAFSIALAGTQAAAAVLAVAGAALDGSLARALLLFAPWLPAVLVQDLWRTVLFRDDRAKAATVNDGAWVVAMAATAPLAWKLDADWAVIGCWGFGGLVGAAVGLAQTRQIPLAARRSLGWWRANLWPFGRWLGLTTVVQVCLTTATVFILVGVLGTEQYGGLQAVVTVFAPLSLVASAVALPGLPAVSRALHDSGGRALRLAVAIGAGAAVVTALYLACMSAFTSTILQGLFGSSFGAFAHLVWPVGVGQIVSAIAIGFVLFLKAAKRGRALLVSGIAGWGSQLVFSCTLAVPYGTSGAAWGLSAGSAVGAAVPTSIALRGGRPSSAHETVSDGTVHAGA